MITWLAFRQASRLLSAAPLIACLVLGCAQPSMDLDDAATRQQLALLMPQEVNIVGPFTRFRSFDEDERPDGIELLIQPVNSFGDPVNIAGDVIVELYEFRRASGDDKGAQLQHWDIPLASRADQEAYWNRTTSMYEFRLQLDPATLPQARKYVVLVTYNTPLGEHMITEHVLEVPLAAPEPAGPPEATAATM